MVYASSFYKARVSSIYVSSVITYRDVKISGEKKREKEINSRINA